MVIQKLVIAILIVGAFSACAAGSQQLSLVYGGQLGLIYQLEVEQFTPLGFIGYTRDAFSTQAGTLLGGGSLFGEVRYERETLAGASKYTVGFAGGRGKEEEIYAKVVGSATMRKGSLGYGLLLEGAWIDSFGRRFLWEPFMVVYGRGLLQLGLALGHGDALFRVSYVEEPWEFQLGIRSYEVELKTTLVFPNSPLVLGLGWKNSSVMGSVGIRF